MRGFLGLLICSLAAPGLAQPAGKVAEQAVMTPAEDVNLKKREIPPVLLSAQDDPYSRESTRNCTQINTALHELDAVLGPDFDSGEERRNGLSATMVAKGVVGSFIPFRGVIREISGAAGAERRYNAAVDAGIARRGFLRGIARARNCRLDPAAQVAASN
jgi:hypothetical protein